MPNYATNGRLQLSESAKGIEASHETEAVSCNCQRGSQAVTSVVSRHLSMMATRFNLDLLQQYCSVISQ